jgi:diguanylate cyclase (GGDEF)-like protein/PAS domain S-box-containing protein
MEEGERYPRAANDGLRIPPIKDSDYDRPPPPAGDPTDAALRASEDRFYRVFHANPSVITITRLRDNTFIDVNEAFERVSGWSRAEVIGRTSSDIGLWLSDAERDEFRARVRAQNRLREAHWRFRDRAGNVRHAIASADIIRIDGEDCLLVIGQDITPRKLAEEQMRKLSRAVENTSDSVVITDAQGVIEYANPAFERMTGYVQKEILGAKPGIVKSGRQGEAFYHRLWETLRRGGTFNEVFVNRRKSGELYYEEKTITPIKDADGRITHFVATGRDITQRMQVQERLEHMAHHDALTSLPNRTLFHDRLRQVLAHSRRRNVRAGVVFLDLDEFKEVNDHFGHDCGDRLLQSLAARLRAAVREGDTVARFGGDEFAVLLDEITSDRDVVAIADKLLRAAAETHVIDGREIVVTASLGISVFPNDAEDANTLLKHADIAMYRAKELGKNTHQFYSPDMSAKAFERLSLERNLRRAFERREFVLHYQPLVDAVTGRLCAVEALLRWQHPEQGLILPENFLALLEDTGLIGPVGEWILATACEQADRWCVAGHKDMRIGINVCARQFHNGGIVDALERILAGQGCANGLDLEVCEGTLATNVQRSLDTLDAVRRLGIGLTLDRFGTGQFSLSLLRRLRVDTLKLDQSFVHGMTNGSDDAAIVSGIIALAHNLKISIVADGVETAAQRDFLLERGCRLMQGHLFGRAMPAASITRLLEQGVAPAA